jgi:hypothetical protein
VVVTSGVAFAVVLAARLVSPEILAYSPYPPASLLPPFSPVVGGALLLLTLPALLAPRSKQHAVNPPEPAVGSPMERVS